VHLVPDDRIAGIAIPVALRPLIGNRIYGCDDCQLCCPWNRFAHLGDPDFAVRNGLDAAPADHRSSPGARINSTLAWRAARSAASATGAGCATLPSPSATPSVHRRLSLPCPRAATTPRRWCASMSAGRWRSTPDARSARRLSFEPGGDAARGRPFDGGQWLTCWDSSVRRRPRARPSGCSVSDP
jgi:hypothetical protein